MQNVTIIVPVYGDWPSLKQCIESLKQYVDTNHTVMLVNDCGPDVDLMEKNIKEAIKAFKNFIYYRNKNNLGFVGTCNRAVLELEKTDNDIMLLNSDTRVTKGFLQEMLAVLYSDQEVGAVSPRSNNATLATVPLSSAPQKGLGEDKSYEIYTKIKSKLPRFNQIPVAHGFCMLIKRSLIKEFGLFDPIFGKGYGEEVDFCMRISKKGYKCLLSNWAYVFHLEARSFSLETKAKLLEENNKIIWERYPDYRQLVRDYMSEALVREGKIEQEAGYANKMDAKEKLKRLIRRNKNIHRLARGLKSYFMH